MGRVMLVGLLLLEAAGCASSFNGSGMRNSSLSQNGVAPQLGEWCTVRLTTERLGPLSERLRFITGRVEKMDDTTLHLADVLNEERVLSGPQSFRRIPYLSRLTSLNSEIELLEKRSIPRTQIASWQVIPKEMAQLTRDSLVPVGNKWVRQPIGLDFDFNVPTQ